MAASKSPASGVQFTFINSCPKVNNWLSFELLLILCQGISRKKSWTFVGAAAKAHAARFAQKAAATNEQKKIDQNPDFS